MQNHHFRIRTLLVISILFAACSPPGPTTTTRAVPTAQVLPAASPTEVLRLTGSGAPFTSPPLHFSSDVALLVHWEQSSTGEFSFAMTNASDPPGEEVTFEFSIGPSTGSGEAEFSSGSYVVNVTAADGPWLIWIETIELPPS